MKTKVLFLALLALITFGCRTSKQTSTSKAEVKTAANLDVKQSNESKKAVDSTFVVVDKGVSTVYTDEVITVSNLSKPDSTGKQWPTKTTVIKRTISNKKAADLNTKSTVNKDYSDKTTLKDNSDYKSDSTSTKTDTLTKETKTPAWVYLAGFGLLVAVGIFLYIKFK